MTFRSLAETTKKLATKLFSVKSMSLITFFAISACTTGTPSDSSTKSSQMSEATLTSVGSKSASQIGETDYAKVIRVNLAKKETIPAHQGGDRIVVSLNDYTISFEEAGKSKAHSFKTGDVHFHSASVHQVRNLGTESADFVVFERLSNSALPKGEPKVGSKDIPTPVKNAMEKRLFTNAEFDVYKVSVKPGGRLAAHLGYARAIYSMDIYKIDFHENGESKSRTFNAGDVHFHTPGMHWIKNTGKTVAEFIVVDFKK